MHANIGAGLALPIDGMVPPCDNAGMRVDQQSLIEQLSAEQREALARVQHALDDGVGRAMTQLPAVVPRGQLFDIPEQAVATYG